LITNLKNLEKNNRISAKVCIVGGGTAGLFLAHRLRLSKIPVTIVEAGGDQANKLKNFIYKFKNNSYEQSIADKNFSLGGTSTIWGGQMIPFQKSDMKKRDYIGLKSWSIKYKQIAKYFLIVKKSFRLEFLKNKSKFLKKKIQNFNFSNKDFDLRFSTFMKPQIKNFYNFFYKNIKEDDKLNIYINARVFEINNSKNNNSIKNIISNIQHTDSDKILFRYKNRISLIIFENDEYGLLRLDLTFIKSSNILDSLHNANKTFEIELEYKPGKSKDNDKIIDILNNEIRIIKEVLERYFSTFEA
jgi:hypothetical protein